MSASDYRAFELSDGATLAYLDRGAGDVILMVAGWSQSVEQFKHQFDDFSRQHRVIAVDWRGHGRSSNAEGGYRTGRLAADLREFIGGLGLNDLTIVAHSVGASIVWAYLDVYGESGIRRLVFVDQATSVAAKPDWTAEQIEERGCSIASLDGLAEFYDAVNTSTTVEETMELVRGLFSAEFPESELRWVAEENLRMPRPAAAALLWDTALNDWSDLFGRIQTPTLVVGAESSLFPARSQAWIAEQLGQGRSEIFAASEGGSHFMFMENPERFNRVVLDFIATS